MSKTGTILALYAAKEQCEALGLLVLLRYMPVHHTALPQSLNPLSDLLTAQSGMDASADEPSALYSVIVGSTTSTLSSLLDALLPLLTRPSNATDGADTAHAVMDARDAGSSSQLAWETRAKQLATIAIMAAMHAEKDLCQLQHPVMARTAAAVERHRGLTKLLHHTAQAAATNSATKSHGALGALLITWCVVILEVAPDDEIAEWSSRLAVRGEELGGMSWSIALFDTFGFRHDDPQEEISSIARNLHFDLVAGMLSQQRFRASEDAAATVVLEHGANRLADTGWPAHSEPLIMLMAAVLRGRPALCRTFWSASESMEDGSLGSLLLNTQYPLRIAPLASLLAALCADADSAARAWRFAHELPCVCHCISEQMENAAVSTRSDELFAKVGGCSPKAQSVTICLAAHAWLCLKAVPYACR